MGHSIQDNLKKINRGISFFDVISLCLTALLLIICALYLAWLFKEKQKPVLYETGYATKKTGEFDTRPFGSRNGTTYTYSWCQGADMIKPENRIFYENAEQAERYERRISKLCEN